MKKLKCLFYNLRCKVIFPNQLAFGVFFLKLLGNQKYCRRLARQVASAPAGSVGEALQNFMQKHQFEFVPYYEKHDLKHAILGFAAEAQDEMRMQAFMFGNAGFSPMITLIYLTFVIWTPEMWSEIPLYYYIGQKTAPIAHYTVEDLLDKNLLEFRQEIGLLAAIRLAEAKFCTRVNLFQFN